ncbi:MAG: heparinase II/III domain-containing protein, partial [Pyrinomonadaceae bacterium]
FHYMVFSLHWVVRYLDALEHATGEDLYPRMRERFAPLKYYVAHSILPDGRTVFDFGDTGRGAAERNRKSGGALNSGYEVLYRLAAKYRDAEAQGVADWLRRGLKHATWEDHWAFYAHDPSLRPSPVGKLPTSHFFQNNGTVFWRSGWDARATAFAFRAAPPEGHHVTALLPHVPDWRLSTGHAHPDANSFIIYAHGKYLTGDTGYTGVKRTSDHNTVLVDGRGQSDDGRHEVFKEVPYEQLDRIRVVETWATPEYFYARGEAASAYPPELKLTRFDRHFLYVAPDYFLVWDELAAAEPRRFSWMLNAEQAINELAPRQFVLASGGAGLLVEQLVAPAAARAEILPQVVTAQGRPGSIERGVEEQRGVQLVLHTDASEREGEFLHFFRPLEILSTAREEKQEGEPQVAPLRTGAARAVKINWPGGDTEVALLRRDARGEIVELVTDAARAIARVSPAGAWRRLILHNGTHLSRGGVAFLRASRRASITLTSQAGDASWRGTISADGPASISICVARRPRRLLLGGAQVRFEYDAARRTVTFEVGAGQSSVEGL